jgi:hypothetical protein
MAAKKRACGTAAKHRTIQKQVSRADRKRPKQKVEGAMQSGARHYTELPNHPRAKELTASRSGHSLSVSD